MDSFCHEILIEILQYLGPKDLLNVTKAIPHLGPIINYPKFWKKIHVMGPLLSEDDAKFFFEKINAETESFCMASMWSITSSTTFTNWTSFSHIRILALHWHRFDGELVQLGTFPKSIEELSLNHGCFVHAAQFFESCSQTLTNLKVVLLEHCYTLDGQVLKPMSELPELELLSIRGSRRITDDTMTRFSNGFAKLRLLDIFHSGVKTSMNTLFANPRLNEVFAHADLVDTSNENSDNFRILPIRFNQLMFPDQPSVDTKLYIRRRYQRRYHFVFPYYE